MADREGAEGRQSGGVTVVALIDRLAVDSDDLERVLMDAARVEPSD